jgi:hypothetical protein
MKNKIQYGFSLLGMLIISFLLALLAPFRKPIRDVRRKIKYARLPHRAVFLPALAVIMLFLLALVLPAGAQDSFGTTNNLVAGTQYTLYPTNASGIGTGHGVEMKNGYKTVGISVSGDVINSNAAPIGLTLVRADNSSSINTITNWETTPIWKLTMSVPAMTNHFTWTTNLPDDFTGGGLEMGVEQLTNNFTTGCSISNLVVKPLKKFSTINYP